MEYLLDRIKELVSPLFTQKDYDLVDIAIRRESGKLVLRLLVDRPTGGITLDECASLNEEINQILDEVDLIQESFSLEISSPGLDRPLRTEKDFRRKLEKNIRVFTSEPINNRTEFLGKLIKVTPESITLLVESEEVIISYDKINKAKEVYSVRKAGPF